MDTLSYVPVDVRLPYDNLLSIAVNLDSPEDVYTFLETLGSPLLLRENFWYDFIHRKLGYRLKEATQDDYSLLYSYAENYEEDEESVALISMVGEKNRAENFILSSKRGLGREKRSSRTLPR